MKSYTTDEQWMRRAIALARRGMGSTHPNPRVGALLVRDQHIVGEGWHQRAGEAHAEIHAIANAGAASQGATLYVSLEPCHGQGRTPPCTRAILQAGIRRVVYASADPNPHMQGGGAFLQQQGVAVSSGLMQAQADAINRPFFHYLRTGLPYVIAKAAISLDGKLATRNHHSQWITGKQARRHAHRQRALADVVVVGGGTLRHDNPSLNVRDVPLKGLPPLRVVMMRQLPAFNSELRLLQVHGRNAGNVRFYIIAHDYDEACAAQWRQAGVDVVVLADIQACLRHLAAEGRLQVLLEGGGQLHGLFLEQRLACELLLYQAPCLIGGRAAVNFWHGKGIATMPQAPHITQIKRRMLGRDQLIHGQIEYVAGENETHG